MARAVADQEIDHRAVGIVIAAVPAGGPSDHATSVVVAVADHIAAGIDQRARHSNVALRSHPMQRVGVVAFFAVVDVETAPEQGVHGINTAALCRRKE